LTELLRLATILATECHNSCDSGAESSAGRGSDQNRKAGSKRRQNSRLTSFCHVGRCRSALRSDFGRLACLGGCSRLIRSKRRCDCQYPSKSPRVAPRTVNSQIIREWQHGKCERAQEESTRISIKPRVPRPFALIHGLRKTVLPLGPRGPTPRAYRSSRNIQARPITRRPASNTNQSEGSTALAMSSRWCVIRK